MLTERVTAVIILAHDERTHNEDDMARKLSLAARIKDSISADKIIAKKDGTFEFRRGYFYRHGATPEQFAARIAADLKAQGYGATLIEADDVGMGHWRSENKNYFYARFRIADKVQGAPAPKVVQEVLAV